MVQMPRYQGMGQRLVTIVNDEQILELYEAVVADQESQPHHRDIRIVAADQRNVYQAVGVRRRRGACCWCCEM